MKSYLSLAYKLVIVFAVVHAENQCGNPVIGSKLNKRLLPRIVGGKEVVNGSWPWQVQIVFNKENNAKEQCGGSIISSRWIVTAGHCFVDKYPGTQIFAGLQGRTDYYHKNVKFYKMSKTIIHPEYLHSTATYYDVRVIQTNKLIELSDYVRPVCLATPEMKGIDTTKKGTEGKKCVATGWGKVSAQGSLSDTLLEVELPLINFEQCSALLSSYRIEESVHLCAGSLTTDGKGVCVGDSGGPLVCTHNDNTWYLVGITSFGKCALAKKPGVFTRVTGVYSWIKTTTNFDKDPPFKSSGFNVLYNKHYNTLLLILYTFFFV